VNTLLNSVIPAGIRRSLLEGSNAVEEPAVRLRPRLCVVLKSVPSGTAMVLVLLLMPLMAGAQTKPKPESELQKQLNNLTTSLDNGSVTSINILHMPDRMETRASVTPEKLEEWWDCRISLSKVSEWAGRDELVQIMKSTKVVSDGHMPDLRSAIIFNDTKGNRIVALYFGRYFGRYMGQFGGAEGSIGNIPVKFNGDLATWLKHMIPSSLQ
jgi:hypothetical protein